MVKSINKAILLMLMGFLVFPSCSKNSLDEFNPEISNSAGNFQLQATDVSKVTDNLEYLWINPGTKVNPGIKANIDHSSVIDKGAATLKIFDSEGTEVYSRNLNEDGSSTSSYGIPGTWTIRVELSKVSGTLNFRVEEE
jgi:hypothetical protein